MIRRILVALDPDTDSKVATQYAIRIARETGARITGLAVVDTKTIESSSRGGGIGSMYYAEKLRENLTQETRAYAQKLITEFERHVEGSGVDHIETVEEGVPFHRIVEDMKVHDLLVMGCDPHFFYGHPKQRTNTIAGVFHNTIGPSLIVPKKLREIKKVIIASNGENSSSRAVHRFVEQAPFGRGLEVDVMYVQSRDNPDVEFHLQMMKEYLTDHGFTTRVTTKDDHNKGQCIIDHAKATDADLIITGSTTSKGLTGYHLSKTTDILSNNQEIAVYVHH